MFLSVSQSFIREEASSRNPHPTFSRSPVLPVQALPIVSQGVSKKDVDWSQLASEEQELIRPVRTSEDIALVLEEMEAMEAMDGKQRLPCQQPAKLGMRRGRGLCGCVSGDCEMAVTFILMILMMRHGA